MSNENPQLTQTQITDEEQVRDRLGRPSPWLVETTGDTQGALPETPPAQLTAEQIREAETIQEHLDKPSPWLDNSRPK